MSSFKSIICGIISATLFGISGILASILFRQAAVAPEWLVGVRMLCAGAVLLCMLTLFTKEAVFSVWQHTYTALLSFCLVFLVCCWRNQVSFCRFIMGMQPLQRSCNR